MCQEAEAEGLLHVWGQTGLQSEFQAWANGVRLFLKIQPTNQPNKNHKR